MTYKLLRILSAGVCAGWVAGAAGSVAGQVVTNESQESASAAEASPATRTEAAALVSVESWDHDLATALAAFAVAKTPENIRRVAVAYLRLRVPDVAERYLSEAIKLDPMDGAAYELRARIWRDWGYPGNGLGDAYRAVSYNSSSASPLNTLGTLLQALGRRPEARTAYEAALARDPSAAYALNNLCYLMLLDNNVDEAAADCRRALDLDPGLKAARNNLGLTLALSGRLDEAREAFVQAAGPAAASYNFGMLYLASGRWTQAKDAFDTASRLEPTFEMARLRSQQSAILLQRAAGASEQGRAEHARD